MRLPILLYRVGLGWILGKRFLLLEHRGRKSGQRRLAVIEVVAHDPQDGSFVVVAAWGNRSDWYKNITAQPIVNVTVGSTRFDAVARTISRDEAAQHLAAYARHHPTAFRQLGSLLIGQASRQPADIIQSFVHTVPLVKFSPLPAISRPQ
jgi:deazaflavin-dependent oxidoreductase (nitroreductase family)